MTDDATKREYRSDVRAQQAAATRARILEFASRSFVERGFAGTTIERVARDASVAVPTVYAAFGTKRELLAQAIRFAVRGDDGDRPLLEHEGPRSVADAPSQGEQLRLFARDITERLERVGPLMGVLGAAALTEPELAELRDRLQRSRLDNLRTMVDWLVAKGPLRPGLTASQAAELCWTLASPEVHGLLRREQGWSQARFAAWLEETLVRLLLVGEDG